MRSLVAIGLVLSVGTASADERLDELFATWEKASKDFKSLVVQGKRTTIDSLKGVEESLLAQARLVRTSDGTLRGIYRLKHPNPRAVPEVSLLVGRNAYVARTDEKVYSKFEIEDGNVTRFLAAYLNPMILLLDRKRAEEEYVIAITKRDELYTYLKFTQKRSWKARQSLFWDNFLISEFDEAQLVVVNRTIDSVPKYFPIRIWFRSSNGDQVRYDVTSWQLNEPDKLDLESLSPPEEHEGWTVRSHPLPILRDRKGSYWDYFPNDLDFYPKEEKK
jgi:hypothetical protein